MLRNKYSINPYDPIPNIDFTLIFFNFMFATTIFTIFLNSNHQ